MAEVSLCCDGFDTATTEEQDAAIWGASEILFQISNRVYSGECSAENVRPCNQGCGCWGLWSEGIGFVWEWDRTAARWSCEGKTCGCSPTSDVVLSGVPIREITEVLIDGVPLDPDEYALMEPNRLVRMRDVTDPKRRLVWPGCQIMDLPETEPGTFAISYTYGADPPQSGRAAAAALACELFKACGGETGECALPENVTRVVREGLTMESVGLAAGAIKAGTTGILDIDAFVGIFAGYGSSGRSSVWSPDLDYPRRFRPPTGT